MPLDVDRLVDGLFERTQRAVERAVSPLRERIAVLEARTIPEGRGISQVLHEDGNLRLVYTDGAVVDCGRFRGVDGTSPKVDEVAAQAAELVKVPDVSALRQDVAKLIGDVVRLDHRPPVDVSQIEDRLESLSRQLSELAARTYPTVDEVIEGALKQIPDPTPLYEKLNGDIKLQLDGVRAATTLIENHAMTGERLGVEAAGAIVELNKQLSEIKDRLPNVAIEAVKAAVELVQAAPGADVHIDTGLAAAVVEMRGLVEAASTVATDTRANVEHLQSDLDELKGEVAEYASATVTIERASKDAFEEVRAIIKDDFDETLSLRTEVKAALEKPGLDLSSYATQDQLNEVRRAIPEIPTPRNWQPEIEAAIAAVPLPDLSSYATIEELGEVRRAIPEISAAIAAVESKTPLERDWQPAIDAAVVEVRSMIPDKVEGSPGLPGRGIKEIKQNADGELIVKYTTDETENVGRVRGADGLGFDDIVFEKIDERNYELRLTRGDQSKTVAVKVPGFIYKGIWRDDGIESEIGDAVTFSGGLWIAEKPGRLGRPGSAKSGWRLAVKRGQPGE